MSSAEKNAMLFDTLIFEMRKMANDLQALADRLATDTRNANRRRVYRDGQLIGLDGKPQAAFDDELIGKDGLRK
jgi:hypothetical protein